jgi:pimeloyl-ACP methyl ester carboxylesterase
MTWVIVAARNDVCDWIPLAQRLAATGHRVVVFQYLTTSATGEGEALAETLAVARAAAGAGRFALVGASLGGRIVIEAAARHCWTPAGRSRTGSSPS